MNVRLSDLASIRSGFTVRRESKTEIGQEYRIVQIRNISDDGHLSFENPSLIKMPEMSQEQLLIPGEVLMVAKGSKPRAAVFIHNDRPTIATSQFFVLRPKKEISARYLACFLNQPDTLRNLGASSAGSSIQFLPKDALLQLSIPVPPIEIQNKIAEIHELGLKEQQLLTLLAGKRRQFMELSLQYVLRAKP
jgi:restriction endonuclease S subunit